MTKPKLAVEVPEPPVVTPEMLAEVAKEAALWRAELRQKIRAIENITAEDLRTRVR